MGIPLAAVALLKLSGLAHLVPDGQTILLESLLDTCTPSASTITQMAQIYGKDADYASAINVVTTLLCIFTMPLMVGIVSGCWSSVTIAGPLWDDLSMYAAKKKAAFSSGRRSSISSCSVTR